jgi:hypothetical protein
MGYQQIASRQMAKTIGKIGFAALLAFFVSCDKPEIGQWEIQVNEVLKNEDVCVSSMTIRCRRDARLTISEKGQVRDGIQLTRSNDGAAAGTLVICAYRCTVGEGRGETKIWYRLQRPGLTSTSGDVIGMPAENHITDVFEIKATAGTYHIGQKIAFITFGERTLQLSVE